MVVTHNHAQLARLLATRKDVDNDRFEIRLYAVSLSSLFMYWVMEPGLYILLAPQSSFAKAAVLTSHPDVIGWLFILAGLCAAPMTVWSWMRRKPTRWDKLPRQVITRGAIIGALLFGLLWYTSKGTDFDAVLRSIFLLRCAVCLWFGFLFSRSLNSQMIREKARELGVQLNTEYQDVE